MHVNPCGRAIDWIQFPFEVDCRLHDAPDAPIVRQRWLFTDQPFLPVGTGCVFMNRIWDGDDAPEYRLGMLPPAINNYEQDARWHLTPGLSGKHICNPDWLVTGEPPNHLPPTQYDSNWIPTCCGVGTAGGIEIGGQTGDVWSEHPYGPTCCDAPIVDTGVWHFATLDSVIATSQYWRLTPAAGTWNFTLVKESGFGFTFASVGLYGPACNNTPSAAWSSGAGTTTFPLPAGQTLCADFHATFGEAPVAYRWVVYQGPLPPLSNPTAGGLEVGGSVGDRYQSDNPTAGGLEVGGSAGDRHFAPDATAGGLELGGEVGDLPNTTDGTAGGLEAGGEVGDVPNDADPARGGLEAGGAVGDLNTLADPAAGGMEAGGSAGDLPAFLDPAAGGLEAGGAAGDTYTPPVPVFDVLSSGTLSSGWTAPSPIVAGRLLVAFVATNATAQTAAAGWHQEQQVTSSAGGTVLGCYTRTATGGDPQPITGAAGQYICYEVKNWNAIDTSASAHDSAPDTHAIAPSIAIAGSDFIMRAFAAAVLPGATGYVNAGTVTRNTLGTPNLSTGRLSSSTNPSGTATANLTVTEEWATVTIAIK